MERVLRFSQPDLHGAATLMAFEGWNDASEAASGALTFLLGQHEVDPFAAIDPEDFFDFSSRRPTVEVDESGFRHLSWPRTNLFALSHSEVGRDLVAVLGDEPHLRWRSYAREVLDLLQQSGVEQIVLMGAFIGQVAHTLPVPIIGVGTDPDMVERHGLLASRYEGPTGIVGVMMEACQEADVPAISLWAAVPHYLAANPNPKAMLALLGKAAEILRLDIDTDELTKVAGEFEARVDEAMNQSPDFAQYVERLETTPNDLQQVDPEAGRQLVEEVEQFLREHGV